MLNKTRGLATSFALSLVMTSAIPAFANAQDRGRLEAQTHSASIDDKKTLECTSAGQSIYMSDNAASIYQYLSHYEPHNSYLLIDKPLQKTFFVRAGEVCFEQETRTGRDGLDVFPELDENGNAQFSKITPARITKRITAIYNEDNIYPDNLMFAYLFSTNGPPYGIHGDDPRFNRNGSLGCTRAEDIWQMAAAIIPADDPMWNTIEEMRNNDIDHEKYVATMNMPVIIVPETIADPNEARRFIGLNKPFHYDKNTGSSRPYNIASTNVTYALD